MRRPIKKLTVGSIALVAMMVLLLPVVAQSQGLPQFRSKQPPAAPSPGPVTAPKSEASPLDPVSPNVEMLPEITEETAEPSVEFLPEITEETAEPAVEFLPEIEVENAVLPQETAVVPSNAPDPIELDPVTRKPMLDPIKSLRTLKNLQKRTLFIRLGGRVELSKIVHDFYERLAADERINKRFEQTNRYRFQALLFDQLCEATGGACLYSGENMQTAHQDMKITPEEFEITGQHLAATLDSFYIPEKEKKEVLAIVGSLANDVINR